jgi:hypothetical protein
MKRIQHLIFDEFGSIDTMGYLVMVTLIAIGGITGLATLRDGIVQEYGDIGLALEHLDQSFTYTRTDCDGGTITVTFDDGTSSVPEDVEGEAPGCMDLTITPTPGESGEDLPDFGVTPGEGT